MSGPLNPGDLISGRYEVQHYLDEGGMQFVYVARDQTTDREVALKTPKNNSAQKRFNRSAVVAAKVNHPNVAKTLDYLEEGGRTFLIEELIDGKDLKKALLTRSDFVDPYLAARVFHHLAKAIAAAHHTGVVHRDLKPTNVMVVGDYNLTELKITDFGIAKMAEAEMDEAAEGGAESLSASATAVGALPYMAPEAIEEPGSVGLPADIWSVGAMMYHILCGKYPFGSGLRAVPKIVAAEKPEVPRFVYQKVQFKPLASDLMTIIYACLEKDPSVRPTADELVKMCSGLCYSISERHTGKVDEIRFNAYGMISSRRGRIFYHNESVFGKGLKKGDDVLFSSYPSGQLPRALPVLKLKKLET